MSTGPQFNTYIIPDVQLGDTFQEWRNITNNDIIDKLNRLKVYVGASGDGISVGVATDGTLTVEHSGYVAKGVTFGSDVTILGQMTTVHSNNVLINDYNLVLGSTGLGGTNDAGISGQGGGGLIIARLDGASAEWLWFPTQVCGTTGSWRSSEHIQFLDEKGLVVSSSGNMPIFSSGASCERINFSFVSETSGHTYDSVVLSYQSEGVSSSPAIQIDDETFTTIYNGVNRKRVTQTGHGFTFGQVIAPWIGGGFTLAKATSKAEAEAVGIVSAIVDADTFDLTFQGEVRGNFSSVVDFATAGSTLGIGYAYFLSGRSAGNLTTAPPGDSQVGYVRKPMLVALAEDRALVTNYLGGEIAEAIETSVVAQGNRKLILQTDHGFKVGDAIRYAAGITSPEDANGSYVKAEANNNVSAETIGLVTEVVAGGGTMSDKFYVTTQGFADLSSGPQRFTPGSVYFLSTNSAGSTAAYSLSTQIPETLNQVKKPMFIATAPASGLILHYVGRMITPNENDGDGELDSLIGKTFVPNNTSLPWIRRRNNDSSDLTYPCPGTDFGWQFSGVNTDLSSYIKFAIHLGQSSETQATFYGEKRFTDPSSSPHRYNSTVDIPNGATHVLYSVSINTNLEGHGCHVFSGEPTNNYPYQFDSVDNHVGILDADSSDDGADISFTRVIPINRENPNGHIGISLSKPTSTGANNNQINMSVKVLGFYINDTNVLVPTAPGSQGSRNLIVNGNFDLWQRGKTSFTPTDGITFGADRWRTNFQSTTGTIDGTYARGSFASAQTVVPGYPKYYLQFKGDYTGTTSANDLTSIEQPIENARTGMDKFVTVSLWAKGSVSGRVRCRMTQNFQSTTPNKSYHMGYMDVSTGWQQFVFTKQLGKIPAGGTFGDASFLNFAIDTTHAPETTYSGIGLTQDALFGETVNYNGVLSIAQVQVVEGRTVPEFQRANDGDEINRAQRFYAKSYEEGVSPGSVVSAGASPSIVEPSINDTASPNETFPTKMRVAPSLTFYTPSGTINNILVSQARTTDGGPLQNLQQNAPIANSVATSYAITSLSISSGTPPYYDVTAKFHYTADAEIYTD